MVDGTTLTHCYPKCNLRSYDCTNKGMIFVNES
uniref:Uncharacterized protein n=1 Tax=Ciona intestinalis TaxID=7719 RepID=F6UPV9_CIOIN